MRARPSLCPIAYWTAAFTAVAASSGRPVSDETVAVAPAGRFSRRFETSENDVWFVELRPL